MASRNKLLGINKGSFKSKLITRDSLDELINTFMTVPYKPDDPSSSHYLERCWYLFKLDYDIGQVANNDGSLCAHYPPTILIPERQVTEEASRESKRRMETVTEHKRRSECTLDSMNGGPQILCEDAPSRQLSGWVHVDRTDSGQYTRSLECHDIGEYGSYAVIGGSRSGTEILAHNGGLPGSGGRVNDALRLTQLFLTARFARARSRFAVPVLIYRNKNICRGATLSVGAEQYGRTGWDFLSTGGAGVEEGGASNLPDRSRLGRQEQLCDKVRGQDVKLLKQLRVRFICDLMYQQKKLKFLLPVASSEKVDKAGRYRDFHVASMPYPGCESFRGYQSKYLKADNLHFNWKATQVDATLSFPTELLAESLDINWTQYKEWSTKELTSCYLRFLLYHLHHLEGGLFVHCISGWDRTPMFISLLRLSLWADGLAHASLGALEMLFFTVAYDWRLFGHKLTERNAKSEEIFYFGMDYIQHMTGGEFSIHCDLREGAIACPELLTVRRDKLTEVRQLFMDSYYQLIIPKSIKLSKIS